MDGAAGLTVADRGEAPGPPPDRGPPRRMDHDRCPRNRGTGCRGGSAHRPRPGGPAAGPAAARQSISIVQFGNDGPGASAGVPLRFVDLSEDVQAAHLAPAAYVKSVRDYLSKAPARYRPAMITTMVLADGQAVLRVEVSAP